MIRNTSIFFALAVAAVGAVFFSRGAIGPGFPVAHAQIVAGGTALDRAQAPVFGTYQVRNGFDPDPRYYDVIAGGTVSAEEVTDGQCVGYVTAEPTLRIDYNAGFFLLFFSATAEDLNAGDRYVETFDPERFDLARLYAEELYVEGLDTVLLIQEPGGSWYCDDDSAGGLEPLVEFENPSSGEYNIWVGTYDGTVGRAQLRMSELAGPRHPGLRALDWDLSPQYGAGNAHSDALQPLIAEMRVEIGGDTVFTGGADCSGFTTEASTVRLYFTGASGLRPLVFTAQSDVHTVMAVADAEGDWHCHAGEAAGNFDARIVVEDPWDGVYDVWIGTYGTFDEDDRPEATLYISESVDVPQPRQPIAQDPRLNWNLTPRYGFVRLPSGFSGLPRTPSLHPIQAGGRLDAAQLRGGDCRGFVDSAPHFTLDYDGGAQPLALWVLADAESTLVVSTPEGDWYCDDDFAGDENPRLIFAAPDAGFYDVWIGSREAGASVRGTLLLMELEGAGAALPTLPQPPSKD